MIDLLGTRLPRLAAPLFPDVLWRAPGGGRTLYLTFDDGPSAEGTPELLRVLERHDARATCFLVGREAAAHPRLVGALVAAGHALGNHSYTHPDPWLTRPARVAAELDRTAALLAELSGEPPRWMRPPYGRFTRALRAWARRSGQRIVLWDVMPGDFLPRLTPEAIAARVHRLARPGSIVVLHDNPRARAVTPRALDLLLPRLRQEGWRFEALPERLAMRPYSPSRFSR